MIKNFLDSNKDLGILFLRVVIGISFSIVYGLMKIQAGQEMWAQIGGAMSNLGITFAPVFWGFLASLSEFAGGILIFFGLFTRPAAAFMAFTMFVAAIHHLSMRDPWYVVMNPIEMFAVFVALVFIGAGKYSLDYLLFKKKSINIHEN